MENNEQKKAKFKRLASMRTRNVLKKLDVLGNCANRAAYDYSQEDIKKIFSEIDKHVKHTKAKFHFSKDKEFTL